MRCANSSTIAREYIERGKSEDCPIVDMHGHFGLFGAQYLPASPPERMRNILIKAGVKRIVCSSFEALFGDVDYGNAILQKGIDDYPDTYLGYWVINPNYPKSITCVTKDFESSRGFVGFKFLPDYHTYPVTGRVYMPVLEYANERRLIILVHTWNGSAYDSPQMLAKVAEKYRGITFLMGHSGYGDWKTSVKIAKDFPNVYLDTTAVYVAHDFANQPGGSGTPLPFLPCLHVNGIIEFMVENATSRKVLFGTDMPWFSPHYVAGAVLFARIDDEARHDILHRNAERLLKNVLRREL